MTSFNSKHGIGTLMNHTGEGEHPEYAHVMPIYQTSTFGLGSVARGAAVFDNSQPGYIYTRVNNPNHDQVAKKIAVLEGLDLLRRQPQRSPDDVVRCQIFGSGMAAVTSAILARVKSGETVIVQDSLYSCTFNFLKDFAPRFGVKVVWLHDVSPEGWEQAFDEHPNATLAYSESPSNPVMELVDLKAVADIAHRHNAWLMVDNTFATPYCQRPLTLDADVVVHSTTKYISGHGLVIGGAVISPHIEYITEDVFCVLDIFGGSASPFDAWLTHVGLKTFELRMARHCENALAIARFLEADPRVTHIFYPGLESHPDHALAQRQMTTYGGMMSFELKGGLKAGAAMMDKIKVCTLAVSLGNVDTLISHPASTTHSLVPPEARQKMGISDGLVRLSVGVENVDDLIADLDQAMG